MSAINRRRGWLAAGVVLVVLLLIGGGALLYFRLGNWAPWALARAQEQGAPQRAPWYGLLARRYPALAPYTALWRAEQRLPARDAVADLRELSAYLPDGPVALRAHLALARYYASIESPETVTHYNAALAIDDRAEMRLELARYLEEQAANAAAYAHYLQLLGAQREDAFVGARRTAPSVTALASDLLDRGYLNDVLDVLYRVEGCQPYCLRATALQKLGRAAESQAVADMCAACSSEGAPADEASAQSATEPPAAAEGGAAAPTPLALWTRSWELEEAGDYAALLPLYLELAATDSVYADDAAYRARVLAQRLGEAGVAAQADRLLAATQPSWLAYRASGELPLCLAADYPPEALDRLNAPVMARVQALEALGLEELAHQELRLTALVSETPEVLQRMATELSARGYTTEAWSLANAYLRREPCAPRALWELAYPRPHADEVRASAAANELAPGLLWAVMRQESAYQPEIVSWAGARGLMQIMPFTHEQYCDEGLVACAPGVAFVPEPNITMGAVHLRKYTDYYDGDLTLGVLAYNAGPGNVDQWLDDPNVQDRDDLLRLAWFGETREYLQRVMLDALVYAALYGE